MPIFGDKTSTPFANNSLSDPLVNELLKCRFANCEELSAMIKECNRPIGCSDATSGHSSTESTAFVEYDNTVSFFLK